MPRLLARLVGGALLAAAPLPALALEPVSAPAAAPVQAAAPAAQTPAQRYQAVRKYIKDGWQTLSRSNRDLLRAAIDAKHPPVGGRWPVYISPTDDANAIERTLRAQLAPAELAQLEIRHLGSQDPTEHGILYLPHPYVVPGGRFNEMYGWDSYFIVLGLLRDHEVQAAVDMVNNQLYEVEHYGAVLNANRSYYLHRSHPPFLARAVWTVYEKTQDLAWLKRALPIVERYQRFWLESPRITDTGLSRYYDTGTGPAAEVVYGEIDASGQGHYDRVRKYYATHAVPDYDLSLYYDAGADKLTDLFYRADRAMRESGFDPSGRFGPFNAGVLAFNPVCLNSLLYVSEMDLARMHARLGDDVQADSWRARAKERAARINTLMWDPQQKLYLDYDFAHGTRRDYPFATTFYPLWAGIATPEQAAALVRHLPLLEAPGGLMTSSTVTGTQWDAPYGWAPLQLLAIDGLRRYGYEADAERISVAFLRMLMEDFKTTHALYEKYDVVQRRSDVGNKLEFGYTTNVVPFGMSNAAFIELFETLSPEGQAKVLAP